MSNSSPMTDWLPNWGQTAIGVIHYVPIFWDAVVFIAITSIIYIVTTNARSEGESRKGLFGFLFPRELFQKKSTIVDYWTWVLLAAYGILHLDIFVAGLVFSSDTIRLWMVQFIGLPANIVSVPWIAIALQSFVIFLAGDFAYFFQHWLQHKVPVLWSFHRAHHSAEVLTLATNPRDHPIDQLCIAFSAGIFGGLGAGIISYFTGMKIYHETYYVLAAIVVVQQLIHPFRHSQLWVAFGKPYSYIFMAPCMHLIHHSIRENHWDKNMGMSLSVWDWLFGTLYVPETREDLTYGLSLEERGEGNPHPNIISWICEPFGYAGNRIYQWFRKMRPMNRALGQIK